ncbi:MAG: InlB B-repeat-containing protein [Candidatus Fimimonas sp.]
MKKLTKYLILALLVLTFASSLALAACTQDPPDVPDGNDKQVTVTFDTGVEGLAVPSQTFNKGGQATIPQIDEKYTVIGWYTTKACVTEFNFQAAVNSDVTVYGIVLEGKGTEEDPYLIGSAQALYAFTNSGSAINFVGKLTADVSYSSNSQANYLATTFNGVLDGNNHTITLEASNTGLFYKLGENAQIKNLNVVGHIEAALGSCGVIANHNYGTIANVTTKGTKIHWNTSGTTSNGYADGIYSVLGNVGIYTDAIATETDAVAGAGGIVGTNYATGTIKDCVNQMNVRAVVGGGGMCAVNYGTIEHCFNNGCVGTTGDTTSNMFSAYDFSYLGGMAGINYGTIKNCGNLNKVYAQRRPDLLDLSVFTTNMRKNIGGIAGYNVGEVSGNVYVGGIITECFNYGRIHGDLYVGGIAGESSGSITYCASYGLFGARGYLGGIVGRQSDGNPGLVSYCSAMMRVDSEAPSTGKIEDENGVEYEVISLTNRTSDADSNVVEFYRIAKYADHCAYHSNCGNLDAIDATSESSTNVKSTAAKLFNTFATLNAQNNGIWAEDVSDETNRTTATMIALNSSYPIYLNVYLAWQKATITSVGLDGTTKTFDARQGINYGEDALVLKTGSKEYWAKSNSKRNLSGYLPNTGLPTQDVPAGKAVIWTTVQGDASTEWLGICRGDVTLYAMLTDAPADAK